MATVNNKLDVTDLDYDQIKGNLKSFLSNQSTFSGYDFSGSGLNQILNLLAYNTHYNAYYMNMLANEMFLDSASIRNSIVSKARMLNYTPRSMVGSSAKIQATIGGVSSGTTVTIDKFTKFQSSISNKNFTFCTTESAEITPPSSGVYSTQLNIKEGYPVTFTYTKDDNTLETINPAQSVSNYTYEQRLNEDKRKIRVLKPNLLPAFITDFRNIMSYDKSSSFISKSLISSYNPRETGV